MTLIVEVYVGSVFNKDKRKMIAEGVVHNISNLADISNYEGILKEYGASKLGIEPSVKEIQIKNHNRNQSVWALVKKMLEGV